MTATHTINTFWSVHHWPTSKEVNCSFPERLQPMNADCFIVPIAISFQCSIVKHFYIRQGPSAGLSNFQLFSNLFFTIQYLSPSLQWKTFLALFSLSLSTCAFFFIWLDCVPIYLDLFVENHVSAECQICWRVSNPTTYCGNNRQAIACRAASNSVCQAPSLSYLIVNIIQRNMSAIVKCILSLIPFLLGLSTVVGCCWIA